MNKYSDRSDVEKLYRIMHYECFNDYNIFSNNDDFNKLSDSFLESNHERFKILRRDKNTNTKVVEFQEDHFVEMILYKLNHYLVGIIEINGVDNIYTIDQDSYYDYDIFELIYDLYDNHYIFNSELDCKVLDENNTESYDMTVILFEKIRASLGTSNQLDKKIISVGVYNDIECYMYSSLYIGFIEEDKRVFFIKEESVYSVYRKWRWLVYNNQSGTSYELDLIVNGFTPNYNQIDEELIDNYKNEKYIVDIEVIEEYDKKVKTMANSLKEINSYYLGSNNLQRSIFVENCYLDIDKYEEIDLREAIKKLLIYYHWWDEYTFSELCFSIANNYFLRSTRSLIGTDKLVEYFKSRFSDKEYFIDSLLNNFIPRDSSIITMNAPSRTNMMFNYDFLFRNELLSSIRIFENECRLEFNEKIIGAFFNEDILFREVVRHFKDKYKVISQGSPGWLRPQRFDIYMPEINIAIEYQGEQHQRPVDFGGKGKKEAEKQFAENQRRDKLKKEKSDLNDCYIYYVYPKYEMKEVIANLKKIVKTRVDSVSQ